MAKQLVRFDGFTVEVNRDDRGRLVAEVWHNESGKTIAISEVRSYASALKWAKEVAADAGQKA